MEDNKIYTLTEPGTGNLVELPSSLLAVLGKIDFASVAFMLVRPLIAQGVQNLAESGELKELELSDEQQAVLVEKIMAAIDRAVNKIK